MIGQRAMSDVLSIALDVILPIFAIIAIVALTSRYIQFDTQTLADIAFYVFTPFLIFDGLANTDISAGDIGKMAALVIILSLILTLIGWIMARLAGYDRQMTSAFILVVVLMNGANLGLPINEFAFGIEGRNTAVVYFVMSAIIFSTLGVFIATRGHLSGRDALLGLLKVPLVYAAIAGLAFNLSHTELPVSAQRATSLLAQAAVPTMLVVLGLQLVQLEIHGNLNAIALATGTRLVISPLIAVGLVMLLGMKGLISDVSIVESGMPTAVISGVLAAKYDVKAPFVTATILVSTLVSIPTLSIILSVVS
jgi:hypothetical protein